MRNDILLTVKSLIEELIKSLGYELYHIEFDKEFGSDILRITIDHTDGINLDDCEKVSHSINPIIDEKDPVPFEYTLEVCSPGLNRRLYTDFHLEKFLGYLIKVKLKSQLEGKKSLVGHLFSFDDESITIKSEVQNLCIPRKNIKQVNLEGEI